MVDVGLNRTIVEGGGSFVNRKETARIAKAYVITPTVLHILGEWKIYTFPRRQNEIESNPERLPLLTIHKLIVMLEHLPRCQDLPPTPTKPGHAGEHRALSAR